MTFSIVATDGAAYGVAVASKFLAVGSVVPAARVGVGAVATQAFAKVSFKAEALALLAAGADAAAAVAAVTAADAGRDSRQLGIVAAGSEATFTGAACLPWAGGIAGHDEATRYAIQGNMLTSPAVVAQMQQAWGAATTVPLAHRLLQALLAGDAAGGDSRGRQAAALFVVAEGQGYDGCGVVVDLRVDDHPQAPTELARLLELNDLYLGGPQGVRSLDGALGEEVRARLATLGFHSADVHVALETWAGVENYEMRLSPDGIDARVLAALRARTGNGLSWPDE